MSRGLATVLKAKGFVKAYRTPLLHVPAAISRAIYFCSILLLFPGAVSGSQQQKTDQVVPRFQELYGNVRDYKFFRLVELNGRDYILAFWREDNDPLQLWVNAFRYFDKELREPIYKVFSGDVSEELIEVTTYDLIGDGHQELVFLSSSGKLKIIRVVKEEGKDLRLVFENGGSDITVFKSSHEIWIKSRTAGRVDVYKWDGEAHNFILQSTVPIVF